MYKLLPDYFFSLWRLMVLHCIAKAFRTVSAGVGNAVADSELPYLPGRFHIPLFLVPCHLIMKSVLIAVPWSCLTIGMRRTPIASFSPGYYDVKTVETLQLDVECRRHGNCVSCKWRWVYLKHRLSFILGPKFREANNFSPFIAVRTLGLVL